MTQVGVNVINVINKEKADELIKLGFHCTAHKGNKEQQIYSFIASPKLIKILNSDFDKTEFFIDNIVCL